MSNSRSAAYKDYSFSARGVAMNSSTAVAGEVGQNQVQHDPVYPRQKVLENGTSVNDSHRVTSNSNSTTAAVIQSNSISENSQDNWIIVAGEQDIHIFIERDFQLAPRIVFHNNFPPDFHFIQGLEVDENEFVSIIDRLNNIYANAELASFKSCFDTFLQCLSCFSSLCCVSSPYDKCLREADLLIQRCNEKWKQKNIPLVMKSPVLNGMRAIELLVSSRCDPVQPKLTSPNHNRTTRVAPAANQNQPTRSVREEMRLNS